MAILESDPREPVLIYSASALENLGDTRAVEALTFIVNNDSNDKLRKEAQKALEKISEKFESSLLDFLQFITLCRAFQSNDEEVNFGRVFFSQAQSLIGRACVQ